MGGLKVSAGGLAQAFQRAADKLAIEDAALRTQLLASPVLHTDETSWRQNGPCSLWMFTTPGAQGVTFCRVVEHRDRVTFHSIVPPDWEGLLVGDCLSVYATATARQHKCYAHHLRALSTAQCDQNPQAAAADDWCARAKTFFQDAIALKARHPQMSPEERAAAKAELHTRANDIFERARGDPAQERFRARAAKQRDHLLEFPQPRRAPAPRRRHRPQTLLRQQNRARLRRLGDPRLTGRHLHPARHGLRRLPRPPSAPHPRGLHRYPPAARTEGRHPLPRRRR